MSLRYRFVALSVALLLSGSLGAQTTTERAKRDSVAAMRYIAKVRAAENLFFSDWRYEWRKWRDLKGTDPRYWSLHCHADDYELGDEFHVVTTEYSRKSMCPIWFQQQGQRADENVAIDNGVPPGSRPKIREKRARLIAMLDTAFRLWPKSEWVATQRVRLLVDQGEFEGALRTASNECPLSVAMCAMLEGYVHMRQGFDAGAQTMYDFAAASMTPSERCNLLDITVLLADQSARDAYRKLTCAGKREIDATYWWLSDPLFLVPRNERLAAHLHRQATLLMHTALTADEHFDYRPAFGGFAAIEMILRYGWPSVQFHNFVEDDKHIGWLNFRSRDSAPNSSREYLPPRYHTAPQYEQVLDLRKLTRPTWDMSQPWNERRQEFDPYWWPFEHFERPGPLAEVDYQASAFRRETGPLVAVAMDGRGINGTLAGYANGIVAMRGAADTPVKYVGDATRRPTGAIVNATEMNAGMQVVSAEVVDTNQLARPSYRARFAMDGPPGLDSLAAGEVAISDITLYEAPAVGDSLPSRTADAIERMLPSTDLGTRRRVGIFLEIYGVPADTAFDLTMSVRRNEKPGAFRRLGSRLGIVEPGSGAGVVRLGSDRVATTRTFNIGRTPVLTRSLILNFQSWEPGNYVLEIGVTRKGSAPVVSRREFSLSR